MRTSTAFLLGFLTASALYAISSSLTIVGEQKRRDVAYAGYFR